METTFQLDSKELNIEFLNSLKTLFQNQKLEITVRSIDLPNNEWLKAISTNPVFDFLTDDAEDIY
jgi:hypothetical protein